MTDKKLTDNLSNNSPILSNNLSDNEIKKALECCVNNKHICPHIDITVFAEKITQAIAKAETVIGQTISTRHREIVIKELVGEDNG